MGEQETSAEMNELKRKAVQTDVIRLAKQLDARIGDLRQRYGKRKCDPLDRLERIARHMIAAAEEL
jgi:hypothetical protein